ncbi:hypothetical protein HZS_5034 [Henneguya salminicola]|nr:hypothetical protein HZS_5034 [Henneguya salminicola]
MEEDENSYRWMSTYERTWETIKEDDSGSILSSIKNIESYNKRQSQISKIKPHASFMSVMRQLILIIDISETIMAYDYHPNRLEVIIKLLENFLNNFFDQNPISQIGIIVTSNSKANIICDLTSDDHKLKTALKNISSAGGFPSIQNSIEIGVRVLEGVPSSSSREILIIYSSTTTCDPGDIFETISKISNMCVSVISLSSEMFLLKYIASNTYGTHFVCTDEHHLRECLSFHLNFPQQFDKNKKYENQATLIRMGFPAHSITQWPTFCACHFDQSNIGFFCPQCNSKYCSLPTECSVCGLLLVLAPHLARSYQRFFPLNSFKEMINDNYICRACGYSIYESHVYQCQCCKNIFCSDCDISCHDTLGFCPGCRLNK